MAAMFQSVRPIAFLFATGIVCLQCASGQEAPKGISASQDGQRLNTNAYPSTTDRGPKNSSAAPKTGARPRFVPIPASPVPQPASLPGQARDAIAFYGTHQTMQTPPARPINTFSNRSSTAPVSGPRAKPFANTRPDPVISPYLDLYRQESDETVPNYFTFVRPQLEQYNASLKQREKIQRLERTVQQYSAGGQSFQAQTGVPGTGHRVRFLDTAQYYSRFSQ